MSATLSTSVSAVDADGTVFVYVPPNVVAIPRGFSVVNGTYQNLPAGTQATLEGIYQFANGSGQFQALGPVIYRVVSITAPPAQVEATSDAGSAEDRQPAAATGEDRL